MKLLTLISALALLGASVAQADSAHLGHPGHGGNGCPEGSVSVTLSPDSKSISVLFDRFVAEVQGKPPVDRKSCNLAIPLHIPEGFSVSILQVDYRGYNSLPKGAESELTANFFFAGAHGPKLSKTFAGPLDANYYEPHTLAAGAKTWSPCGSEVVLHVDTALKLKTNNKGDQALSTVDSADLSAGLLYLLQWKTCR